MKERVKPWGIRKIDPLTIDVALIRLVHAARDYAETMDADNLAALQRAGYSLASAVDALAVVFPIGDTLHVYLDHAALRLACGLRLDGNGFDG